MVRNSDRFSVVCLLVIGMVLLPILPVRAAACAASPSTPPAKAPSAKSPVETPEESPQQNEARAVEVANRFFDPLLADAKTDVERGSLFHQRGVLYLRSDCKVRAVADLNDALRLLPKDSDERLDALFHRACAFLLLPVPDPVGAVSDLTACLNARTDDAEALLIRGTAYRMLGKKDLAQSDFDRAEKLAPRSDSGIRTQLRAVQEQPR